MSAWRPKAIEACPEDRAHLEDPETTIYQVFFELLPRGRSAHHQNDEPQLQRIYSFAHWCLSNRSFELQNAAGVAFFEHLVDEKETLAAIPRCVEPTTFKMLRPLFEARMDARSL